jgi:hypothetical protein
MHYHSRGPATWGIVMLKLISFAAAFAFAIPAFACEVRLKHPVPTCPAVTYDPEDCLSDLWGKAGDRVTQPAAVHVMTNGGSYYCPSHESCIEMKDLSFNGCTFTHVPRKPNESKEYSGHIFVGDKAWSRKIQR